MSEPSQWWAVWLAEYPDEGSVHVQAESEAQAISLARHTEPFQTEDGEEPLELLAGPVTDAGHIVWEAT